MQRRPSTLNTDENIPPQSQNKIVKQMQYMDSQKGMDNKRQFGREIMNLITQNYTYMIPIQYQQKNEKQIFSRPISVQRNINQRIKRINHSQDFINNNHNNSDITINNNINNDNDDNNNINNNNNNSSDIIEDFSSIALTTKQDNNKCDAEYELEQIDKYNNLNDNTCSLVSIYVKEIFEYLIDKEKKQNINQISSINQLEINGKMRCILIDWLVDVHLKFNLVPETLFLTINLVDRYTHQKQISRSKYQLLGTAALFIASKYCEIYPPAIHYFSEVTDRTFTKQEVLDMESQILSLLDFDLNHSSSLLFYERYSKVLQTDQLTYYLGRYLIELIQIEQRFIKYPASMQACSALYLANKIFQKNICWPDVIGYHSNNSEQSIRRCAKEMCLLMQHSQKMAQQAVQRKFSQQKYMEVAKIMIETKQQSNDGQLQI